MAYESFSTKELCEEAGWIIDKCRLTVMEREVLRELVYRVNLHLSTPA